VKPKFRIVDTVNRYNISKEDILYLNQWVNFANCRLLSPDPSSTSSWTKVSRSGQQNSSNIHSSSPANARHYALRFPRVQKIHDDRTYRDTVSFDELQDMARKVADPLQDDEDS
jgi:DNA ligase-4